MYKIQAKIRLINKEIAQETKLSPSEVEQIISSMWEFLQHIIEDSPTNALYLRHLGTFYGKESINRVISEYRKKKDERSNR